MITQSSAVYFYNTPYIIINFVCTIQCACVLYYLLAVLQHLTLKGGICQWVQWQPTWL